MKTALIAVVILCALWLSGCDKQTEESVSKTAEIVVSDISENMDIAAFPITVCGVHLDKAVEKAVSLSPAITEIIGELGFEDKLVGISGYCDFAKELPRFGSSENPDLEGIIKLAPDAVFTLSALSERDSYVIEQAGIAVITPKVPITVEDRSQLYSDIAYAFYGNETDGNIVKAEKAGENAGNALKKSAANVKLSGFLYITEKFTVAGTDTFESAVLSLSGNNLCAKTGYVPISEIGDVHSNSLVIDDALTLDDIAKNDTLSKLAENAKVYFVDSQGFERPSARTKQIFERLSGVTSE